MNPPSAISHQPAVLILAAGGHAQVVADILMRAHDAGTNGQPCGIGTIPQGQPIGFLDDNSSLLRNKSRLCHCEALFAEAISTPRIGDRFGGKAPPRDDTWSFLHSE